MSESSGAQNVRKTASGLVLDGVGKIYGFIASSHTNGTIKLIDGITDNDETPNAATNTLTFSDVVSDGETVTIGDEVYEFDTDSDVADGNIPVDVSGGATASDAVTALVAAITAESALVNATDGTGDTVVATAKVAGTVGNSITTSTTCADGSWATPTMTGGSEGTRLMVNTYTIPAGSQSIIFAEPLNFYVGLYAVIGGTADITILYN